jgi:antitoxin VapB
MQGLLLHVDGSVLPLPHERHMLSHMPITESGADVTERHASLFRNGRNQAVRIPREFEMEGTEVLIRKEGDRLILTPIRKNRLLDLLASWAPLDESLPDRDDPPPQTRDEL